MGGLFTSQTGTWDGWIIRSPLRRIASSLPLFDFSSPPLRQFLSHLPTSFSSRISSPSTDSSPRSRYRDATSCLNPHYLSLPRVPAADAADDFRGQDRCMFRPATTCSSFCLAPCPAPSLLRRAFFSVIYPCGCSDRLTCGQRRTAAAAVLVFSRRHLPPPRPADTTSRSPVRPRTADVLDVVVAACTLTSRPFSVCSVHVVHVPFVWSQSHTARGLGGF